ncbi:ATP-dependent helicase HrpB [Kiloniella sp. b19]|uniref:ATP-dependent helicase HrpB n=1 Tax=Kiloniella sp. GXU_MW_B19 TaxID=3141326 RepID=UPI0031E177CF
MISFDTDKPVSGPLPIDDCLEDLKRALRQSPFAVLQAPPGAGKTTRVPLALLDETWLGEEQRIIMLEPRRLAARAAAERMAQSLGEAVGQTVGYRVRLDSKLGPKTRIEVVTEGILTRRIQSDPELSKVGLIIFDEFHERSLQADLGLALGLEICSALRDDLKILVMSATLDGDRVAGKLSEAAGGPHIPVVTSEGRAYPVELRYGRETGRREMVGETVAVIEQALQEESGSLLAFLPGTGEIRQVLSGLQAGKLPDHTSLHALYGDLSLAEQRKAIEPAPPGYRKVVLATTIAQTSLTIEGVRLVVDSGYHRTVRFDPNRGMDRLVTERVSKATAEQRSGRAGRTEEGVSYRLWPKALTGGLARYDRPEILDVDLAPLVLELAQWGSARGEGLVWMDEPPKGNLEQAVTLLKMLLALDKQDRLTDHGGRMVRLPLHPRLAHMIVRAGEHDCTRLACLIAALLSERDILNAGGPGVRNADLNVRLQAFAEEKSDRRFDRGRMKQVLQSARQFYRIVAGNGSFEPAVFMGRDRSWRESAAALLSLAYPDRIARRRTPDSLNYLLSGGRGAALEAENLPEGLRGAEFLAVAELGEGLSGKGGKANARIFLAAPLSAVLLREWHADALEERDQVFWDEQRERMLAERQQTLGALVLERQRLKDFDPALMAQGLLELVANRGFSLLGSYEKALSLRQRVDFVRLHQGGDCWPDWSDESLLETSDEWLLPYLAGATGLNDLKKLSLEEILKSGLEWDQQQNLETLAPEKITVPSGSSHRVDYSSPESPVLAVRLQEVFGLAQTPRLLNGALPVTLHLLSPARRPVQVTQDIASFWVNTYSEVKKDMKGQYPKHYWPDDPMQAEATTRTKKAMDRQRK